MERIEVQIDVEELFKKAPTSTGNIITLYDRLERINKTYRAIRGYTTPKTKTKYILSSRSI